MSLSHLLCSAFLVLTATTGHLVYGQNQVIPSATLSDYASTHPVVTTPLGTVVGTYLRNNTVAAFYGVRYGTSPVGSLRWKSPQAVGAWSAAGILNGTAPPPACLSVDSVTYPTAEDCLSVDVWTPANFTANSNFPVIINMVGGGYVRQAAQPGDSLVATSQQTIYIYVRYRVDVTGFLSTKSLSMESTNSVMSSGNYGLQDQQLALKWLQQNARSFGGDPNRVTIFGHSAGSWSMCYHLTMPGSAGLFHSMIGEAGGCDQSFVTLSLEDNEAQGEKFAAALNCSAKQMNYNYTAQNQCMRSYSAVDINRAVDQVGSNLWYYSGVFYPVVDGLTVVDWPQNNFSSNPPLINSVPYLSSGALDETNYIPAGGDGDWVAATIPNNATTGETWATVGGWVSNVTSKHGADYSASKDLWNYYTNPDTVFDVRAYPSGTSTGSVAALVSLTSGIYFQCTQNRQAAAVTRSGSPAYLSKFGYVPQGQLQQAFHGSEVNYWLTVAQPLLYAGNINSTLARSMQQYWLSFIQNGNPNNSTNVQLKWGAPSALPAWPQYTTDGSKPNLQIGNHNTYDNATIFATTGYYDTKCAMLDRVIPYPVFTPRCNIGYTLSADGRVCVTPSASAATPGLPASSVMLSTGATVQQGASSTGTGAESRATGRALFRGLHRAVST